MQCVQVLNANGEIQNFKFPKLTYPYYVACGKCNVVVD